MSAAVEALSEGARFDEGLGAFEQSLREASYILEDVAREMLSYRDAIEYDPDELARSQERLAALQGLMRSYGPRFEDVVARRDEAASLVSMVDDADEHERRAQRVLEAAEERLSGQRSCFMKLAALRPPVSPKR